MDKEVLDKLRQRIVDISIKKDSTGRFVHSTGLVFKSYTEKIVIGRLDENNNLLKLTNEDIETCKKHRLIYDKNYNKNEDSVFSQISNLLDKFENNKNKKILEILTYELQLLVDSGDIERQINENCRKFDIILINELIDELKKFNFTIDEDEIVNILKNDLSFRNYYGNFSIDIQKTIYYEC